MSKGRALRKGRGEESRLDAIFGKQEPCTDCIQADLLAVERHVELFQGIADNFWRRPHFEPFVVGYDCVRSELEQLLKDKQRLEGLTSRGACVQGLTQTTRIAMGMNIRRQKSPRL